jgi:hypothetical protein
MNHYVSLSLTNMKSSVHLSDLYSPGTALRTVTPRKDELMICGQYSYFMIHCHLPLRCYKQRSLKKVVISEDVVF